MRVKLGNGLLIVNFLSWILVAIILIFPASPIRIVLGIPFVLLFPGFVLITALIPSKTGISGIERVALSFGLSIALVILIGLGLNYTPFGIRLTPIMFSLAGVLLVLSTVAWFRSQRLPAEERFTIVLSFDWNSIWLGRPLDKVLSIILIVAIVASVGAVAYTIAKPKPGEEFAEFYILGSDGKAANYPSQVKIGHQVTVIGGIINNYQEPVSYHVRITIDGIRNADFASITLETDEKWEGPLDFMPTSIGVDQKIEFLLFKDSEQQPVETLHIWMDVSE